jgi:hypothetical protein
MPAKSRPHLSPVAKIGVDEVRANQEQHEVGTNKVLIDLLVELRARNNSPVMPYLDQRTST